MANSIGQQVGNYRLTKLLGHGGFADVYLGEHVFLHTQAAIKFLHTRLGDEDIEVFRNEALTIAHLVHPHIVRVLDFDVEDSVPFLIMDYAPNGNLRQRYPKGTRLPSASIVSYVKQVASALQYAHDHKIIHRDVKPENMLLNHNQEVVLSDFGIALVAQSSHSQKTESEMVGTMAYMAPEQIQGKARPASDQYALGAVVYEWLSGKRPFSGSYVEIVGQHLSTDPSPLAEYRAEVPYAVEQVVRRAMAKDPHQRFPRVQDFADALELAYQSPAHVYTPAAPPPPQPAPGRVSVTEPTILPRPSQPLTTSSPPWKKTTGPVPAQQQTPVFAPRSPARSAVHVVGRGISFLMTLILLGALALCGIGYFAFSYFTQHNPPSLTSADMSKSSVIANTFITDIDHQNYVRAYTELGSSITHQTSQKDFVQQASGEDTCLGTITNSTRLDNSTTIQGNTIKYIYQMQRSKYNKPYQLTLTLQPDSAGNWHITDYNAPSLPSSCP